MANARLPVFCLRQGLVADLFFISVECIWFLPLESAHQSKLKIGITTVGMDCGFLAGIRTSLGVGERADPPLVQGWNFK